MKQFLKRIHQGNKGFTLIELLIVIAILGVLAAVIIPNVTGFIGRGEDEAAAAELATVQSTMMTMMVDRGISELGSAVTVAEDDMSAFPRSAQASGETSLYPDYLHTAETVGEYTCTKSGLVTQATTGYED